MAKIRWAIIHFSDETVSLRIKERDGTFLSITMDRNKTIRGKRRNRSIIFEHAFSDLKEKLEASLGEQRRCLARNMRLSVQGASLDQDSLKVSEINLPEDAVIHMVRVQDSTMTIHPTYVHCTTKLFTTEIILYAPI